ncbi:MAG: hypothetical protein FWG50_12995 [Kiritimatiellaeota bacterium]|nr:hypothetical protein [Kiritimatiellota bacterium]
MIRQFLRVAAVTVMGAAGGLAQNPAAEAGVVVVKAKVALLDGSQFFGTPRFTSLKLVMDFGKLDIPLEKVATLNIVKDKGKVGAYNIVRDTVKVGLDNKDLFSGTLEGAVLEFDSVFGDVRLELSQIKSIAFSKQRDIARAVNEPGLLLYAPLDKETADLELFGARMEAQKTRVVPGHAGDALLLESPDAKVTLHLPFSPHAMPEGTIELWVKLPQPRQRFGGGGQPWLFNIENPGTRFNSQMAFGFTGNDGTGKGGLVGRIQAVAVAGTHYAGAISSIAETGLLRDTPDGWHHYAFIWKADGLDIPDARGKALALAVDGRVVAVADRMNNDTPRQAAAEGIRLVITGGGNDSRPLAVSDLKIWSSAKQD